MEEGVGGTGEESGDAPERNRETRRRQEEPEEDGGRAEFAKTEKKTSRDYASNLNICC